MKKSIITLLIFISIALIWLVMTSSKSGSQDTYVEVPKSTLSIIQVQELLPGDWRSGQDERSEINYRADGTVFDVYNGEMLATGTWTLEENVNENFPDSIILTTVYDTETYQYAVLALTEETLELSYLARGNTLMYQRQ